MTTARILTAMILILMLWSRATIQTQSLSGYISSSIFVLRFTTRCSRFYRERLRKSLRLRSVKWIRRVSNVLCAVKNSKSKAGEEIPRCQITRDWTKLKSCRSCGYIGSHLNILLFPQKDKLLRNSLTHASEKCLYPAVVVCCLL